MRRWLWVGALVVAVAVAAWAVMARGGSTAPVRYLTARVARGSVVQTKAQLWTRR